jgi:hypothetical protein
VSERSALIAEYMGEAEVVPRDGLCGSTGMLSPVPRRLTEVRDTGRISRRASSPLRLGLRASTGLMSCGDRLATDRKTRSISV